MIITANYFNSDIYHKELDEMFRARSEVFTKRLNWVPSMNDREVDQFDTYLSSPEYVICVDNLTGEYQGSLRLIQMDRPNMLANVFPYLVPEGQIIPTSSLVIESSRLHLIQNSSTKRIRGINFALGEMLMFLSIYAEYYEYETLVTVTDSLFLRVLKTIGVRPKLYSEEGYTEPDGCVSYVAEFKTDRDFAPLEKFFKMKKEDIIWENDHGFFQ